MRRVARLGDGWLASAYNITPTGFAAASALLREELAAAGRPAGRFPHALVKTTIFYTNVEDFATINAIYARFMPDPPPARSAPANVMLPCGLLISIDAVAVLPSPCRGGLA